MAAKPDNKILVIQTAFLGDIVLTTPFLRELRAQNPEAEIHLLTTPLGKALLDENTWQIRVRAWDKKKDRGPAAMWSMIRGIRAEQFDTIFCLHRSFRSALIAAFAGAERVVGFHEAAGLFAYTETVSRNRHLYEAEKNLAMLPGEFSLEQKLPELPLTASVRQAADEVLRESNLQGKKFVAMAPSSVWATKRWPAERFAEVARNIQQDFGLSVVLLAGSSADDRQVCARVEALAPGAVNLAGKTSFNALRGILADASLLIANDSAPLHISVAVNSPVIGIFGPTVKELGFFPLARPGMAFVVETPLACRPCGLHGHNECPLQHHRCMLNIPASRVMPYVQHLLES